MKTFVWRHNRRLHSWSMINEPNVNQAFYTDAVLIVQAESEEQAYELIVAQAPGWVADELKRLTPKIIDASQPALIFTDIRGD